MLLLSVTSGSGVAILPPEVTAFHNQSEVVALSIPGEDAILRSVVAWKGNSTNQDADNFRDAALKETARQV